MKRIILASLLISAPAWATPDDQLWQQLVGNNEARCSQNLVDAAREIGRLRAQVADLESKLKKEAPNAEHK